MNDRELEKQIKADLAAGLFKRLPGSEMAKYMGIAKAAIKKDTRVNFRTWGWLVASLKKEALELGTPYQSLLSGILLEHVQSGKSVRSTPKKAKFENPKTRLRRKKNAARKRPSFSK